jgi:hypothetical protein
MSAHEPMGGNANDLELAILGRLSVNGAPVDTSTLTVISREITGAGSYTTFATPEPSPTEWRDHVGLDVLVEVPGVPNGLGAVLWLNDGLPLCLEIYTYGEDAWNGSFDGFELK